MKRLAFDIDGIMRPEGPACDRFFQPAVVRVREMMAKAKTKGHFVMAYTAAPWMDYRITKLWLDDHAFEYDILICGKLNYDKLLDDRATDALVEMEAFVNAL